jgi:1-acyl-sn-glycerol-3-phosphate acyltransferase
MWSRGALVIEAAKGTWFNAWFARHARARIRRMFGRVLVAGLADATRSLVDTPILLVANHTSWWDALVALYVSELLLGSDGYAMMDASNLRKVPFFRKVGAFGVDLDDPADGARAIRYTARLLGRPSATVWVFPEGRERSPYDELDLRPGAAQIARVAKRARVIPVGLRYVFAGAERPDLWISFGTAVVGDRDVEAGVLQQRRAIRAELTRIERAISVRAPLIADGFDAVILHRPHVFARVAEQMLVWAFSSRRQGQLL